MITTFGGGAIRPTDIATLWPHSNGQALNFD